MPAPYPNQLRERAVSAYNEGEGSIREVSQVFKIGTATLKRWLKLEAAGSVAPKPMGGSRGTLVDEAGEAVIRKMLCDVPDMTLVEVSEAFERHTGQRVSPQTLSSTVARLGFTRKRGSSVRWLLRDQSLSRRGKPLSKASKP